MSTIKPNQWQALSSYLDQALTLSGEELSAWLDGLRAENPELASQLETLLEEHRAAEKEGFLEKGPPLPSSGMGLAGQTIGAYRVLSLIGHGGMGTVWLAERSDGRFQRRAALKLLNIALVGRGGEERFKREGTILGRVSHPHIAELLDAGVTPSGQPYLVLEYVEREPIDHYCDRQRLSIASRVRLFLDVLDAVAHAHTNLIVHRDIKPSNVLVDKDGQVKLLDFGIAKLLEKEGDEGAATLLTREAGSALTPEYAAPEQITGAPVTTATDVYGLGVLLYLLLTGQHPAGPGSHSPADLLKAIAETEPHPVSDVVGLETSQAPIRAGNRATSPDRLSRQLRGDLDTIVGKALKKNPAERYPSVASLADDLGRYLRNDPIRARPDTVVYRAVKFVRRNSYSVTVAVLALSAMIGGAGVAIYQARIARQRFQDVRKLAHTFVFDLHDEIATLEGSTKAREMMVRTGLEYLDDLARDSSSDLDLQREVAAAYVKIGDAQGYPTKPNLGRTDAALASYQKAGEIYRKIAAKNPAYVPDLAKFYLSYAGLVRFTHDLKRARDLAEAAIQTFDSISERQPLAEDLQITYARAWCTLGDMDEDLAHYRLAWREFSRCGELARAQLNEKRDLQVLSVLSQADERIGTAALEVGLLQQALGALEEDESLLKELLAAEPQNPLFHRRLALVHCYRARVYYYDLSPSFGDPARGLESARRYLDAAEEMVQRDSVNTSAQFSRAIALYWVSFYLREFDARASVRMAERSVRMFDQMIAAKNASYLLTSRRVRALIRLGEAQLKAGRLAEARATAQLALQAERPLASTQGSERHDEYTALVQALILAGETNAATGEFESGESLLREAREQAQRIVRPQELTSLIPLANAEKALGKFYVRRRQSKDASDCYQRLVELWQHFPDTNEYVERERADSKRLLAALR